MNWLSPDDIQTLFKVGKTKSYELLKEFEELNPEEVVKVGKHQRRVPEEKFINFLKQRKA